MYSLGIVRAILLFLVLIVARFHCLNEAMFHRQRGKYLSNRVIRTQQLNSEFECSIFCSTEPSCASVNYKTTGDGQGLCELNNETLPDPPGEHGMDIPEFNHLGIIKRNCKELQRKFSPETKRCIHFGSCKEILKEDDSSENGVYYLQTNYFSQPYPVYCHMTEIPKCGGGGWTLVMKMDGSKNTFGYNSSFWSDLNTYETQNGEEGLTDNESKLASYWKTPFTKICLGMKVNGITRWMKLDYTASSLYSVMADGIFRNTTAGRSAWKALIDGSSLQLNCNKEGFNVHTTIPEMAEYFLDGRLAFIGNNENDCITSDSYIGFGVSMFGCSRHSEITCGNKAMCSGTDNGDKTTPATGFILVQ